MDIGKGNVNGSGSDDLWEGRGGLLTPPSSQDATKMLISPPPEETLRMSFGGKGVCNRTYTLEVCLNAHLYL